MTVLSQPRRGRPIISLRYGASALALVAGPVWAQAAPAPVPVAAPDAAAPAAAPAGGLEDIIVTARKRTESIQNIPVSVTALSAAQIDRHDLTSLEKVAAVTPQFTIGRASNGSGAQLSLRGIGSTSTSIGIEQSVATVVDGVYYGQGRIINEGFFDLQQLEILKGPQSLFFGKNSTAGVISITTADPGPRLEAMVRAGYEFNAQQPYVEGIISTPLTDTLGVRVAVHASKMYDGYFRNGAGAVDYTTFDVATGAQTTHVAEPAARNAPGARNFVGRATLKWQPSSNFTDTLKVSGSIDRNNNPSYNYVLYSCPSGSAFFNPTETCGRHFKNYMNNIPAGIAGDIPLAKSDGATYNHYWSYGITNTASWDLEKLNVTSVTNYNQNKNTFSCDCDYFSSSLTNVWANESDAFRVFSTELRALTSFDGPVNLLAGVYYQHTKLTVGKYDLIGNLENSAAAPDDRYLGLSQSSHTRDETIAGYGQAIWTIVPRVELTAGVRYTHETKKSDFLQPYANPALAAIFISGVGLDADQTFNNWSPEATITWHPTSAVTLYAAYKTGYKSGGFSNSTIYTPGTTADTVTFRPEKARGFEGGIKATLFDRQLRLDLGVYHYKFTDLQVDFFNSALFAFITTNAGGAKTDGVELEADFAPRGVSGLTFHATANYNRARYVDYIAPCYTGETIAQGCSLIGFGGAAAQDISGAPTSDAPRWTASWGAEYETPLGSRLKLGLSANARYSGAYLASPFANPYSRQPSYVSVDASARVHTTDDKWELAVIGKNLSNRFIVTGGVDTAGTGSGTGTTVGVPADQSGFVSLPRTVTVQLTWRY